ncbi:hypothetical protein MU516_04590 [Paracoccus sp. YLB-12]|uniref:Lipoprotein n=1 Tax=Paracoccus maritimus TaxID=2933292 RepID=A0ABT2K6J0_9RHOB|nr:hypothetical protein [Paracoccus sp. YLB-12]MCT4332146.1 hypothetical protein [Paracoccus sp. YLB-12]
MKLGFLAMPLIVAACGGAPAVAPPPEAANVDRQSMSLAAQRFDQFCVTSIGEATDGVDLANAYFKSAPMPALGTLKLGGDTSGEDVGVQYDTRRRGCMVTSSSGKAPNGEAEVEALARAYAARNGGTIEGGGMFVYTVKTPSRTAKFQFADTPQGLYFLVES